MNHFLQKEEKNAFRLLQKFPPTFSNTSTFSHPAQIPGSYPQEAPEPRRTKGSLTDPLWWRTWGHRWPQETTHPPEALSSRQAGPVSWIPLTGTDLPSSEVGPSTRLSATGGAFCLCLVLAVLPPLLYLALTPFIHSFLFSPYWWNSVWSLGIHIWVCPFQVAPWQRGSLAHC